MLAPILPRRHALIAGLSVGLPAVARSLPLRFPDHASAGDARYVYAGELLKLALAKAGVAADFQPTPSANQARMSLSLAEGRFDVAMLPCIGQYPPSLRRVRVPIRRGLLGLRLLLTRPEVAPRLAAVPDLAALRRDFSVGWGADWSDLALMRELGFRLVTGSSYPGLFDMLRQGRFDYLSRGVNEVFAELDNPRLATGLTLVPGLGLHYPLDDYFFVAPQRPDLEAALLQGLAAARADGSFHQLFDRHYGAALARAELSRRRLLALPGYQSLAEAPTALYDVLRAAKTAH